MKLLTRGAVVRLSILALVVTSATSAAWWACIRMPGASHAGTLAAPSASERRLAGALRSDVAALLAFDPRGIVKLFSMHLQV